MTPHSSEHIDSVKLYVLVLVGLLCLTVLTTLVAFVDTKRSGGDSGD